MKRMFALLCLLALLCACSSASDDTSADDTSTDVTVESEVVDTAPDTSDVLGTADVPEEAPTIEEEPIAEEPIGTDLLDPALLTEQELAVYEAVLDKDASVQISAIVGYADGYTYGAEFIPYYNQLYLPEAINVLKEQSNHEWESTLKVDEQGYLVFVADQITPLYYVESDNYEISIVKCVNIAPLLSSSMQFAFMPFPDEQTAQEYADLLAIEYEKIAEQVLTYTQMQYFVEGDGWLEFTNGHLYLNGTATRAIDGDSFTGKIAVSLDSKADVTVNDDGSVTISCYSTVDEPNSQLTDGTWMGYQCFVSINCSQLGAAQIEGEQALAQIALLQSIITETRLPELE